MNKRALAEEIASRADLSISAAEGVIEAMVDVISGTLAGGDKVTIPGFGTFEVRDRSARSGRNPQTGATIEIAATKAPAFKAAAALKKAVQRQ